MEFLAFTEKNKLVNTGMSALIDLDFFVLCFFVYVAERHNPKANVVFVAALRLVSRSGAGAKA